MENYLKNRIRNLVNNIRHPNRGNSYHCVHFNGDILAFNEGDLANLRGIQGYFKKIPISLELKAFLSCIINDSDAEPLQLRPTLMIIDLNNKALFIWFDNAKNTCIIQDYTAMIFGNKGIAYQMRYKLLVINWE